MKFDLNINGKRKKYFRRNTKMSNQAVQKNEKDFFLKKRIKTTLLFISFVAVYYGSAAVTEFKNPGIIFKLPLGFVWLIKNFIPNKDCWKYFPLILKTLGETFLIATAATSCAAITAFCFAVAGSATSGLNRYIRFAVSAAASFSRNVPLVAWAMILLFSFKQNNFTGFLALFIITFGHLLRAFKEMIDETSSDSFEALRASGAPYLSAVFQSIVPSTAPGFVSWLLYAIESNVRDSALIGILTGTGIGFLFNLYFKSFRYNEAGLVILVLLITVLIIDIISNKIRRSLI